MVIGGQGVYTEAWWSYVQDLANAQVSGPQYENEACVNLGWCFNFSYMDNPDATALGFMSSGVWAIAPGRVSCDLRWYSTGAGRMPVGVDAKGRSMAMGAEEPGDAVSTPSIWQRYSCPCAGGGGLDTIQLRDQYR